MPYMAFLPLLLFLLLILRVLRRLNSSQEHAPLLQRPRTNSLPLIPPNPHIPQTLQITNHRSALPAYESRI